MSTWRPKFAISEIWSSLAMSLYFIIPKRPVFPQIGLDWVQTLIECCGEDTESGSGIIFPISGLVSKWQPIYFEKFSKLAPQGTDFQLYQFFSRKAIKS